MTDEYREMVFAAASYGLRFAPQESPSLATDDADVITGWLAEHRSLVMHAVRFRRAARRIRLIHHGPRSGSSVALARAPEPRRLWPARPR